MLGYDPAGMNYALASIVKARGEKAEKITDPVAHTKCNKTLKEVEGMRSAEIRDGAALVKYFSWLDEEVREKGRDDISEYDGSVKLEGFRSVE